MKFDLEGRVAFVTGASSGIGRAAALGFADEGARIAVGYHSNHANAEAVAEEALRRGASAAISVPLDLADPDTLDLRSHLGAIHVLVNNAVAGPSGKRPMRLSRPRPAASRMGFPPTRRMAPRSRGCMA